MMTSVFFPRFIQPRVLEALSDTPVVLVQGPRQCGKTTLVKEVAADYDYLNFDNDTILSAAEYDPVGFVERLGKKVILDEIQRVPSLFKSLKYAIDQDRIPGRFLLTGSSDVFLLPQLSDSLAGRIERLSLLPLAQYEVKSQQKLSLSQLFNNDIQSYPAYNEEEMVTASIQGGFPEPIQRAQDSRKRAWYQNFINSLIEKDLKQYQNIRDMGRVSKLLKILACHTAQLLNVNEVAKKLQVSSHTIKTDVEALRALFLVETLPPYFSNRSKRLIKAPKIHFLDTGILCNLLGVDQAELYKDRTLLGHVIETFVYHELRKLQSWEEGEYSLFYYRDRDQYEVDFVIQSDQNTYITIEVKAASSVSIKDFRGGQQFEKLVGDACQHHYLFYFGNQILNFGPKNVALPMHLLF